VGPGDAPWIRRDLVPASIDWDWFFYGTDGCLSAGAGTGVMVAYILDDDPAGPNYALLTVAGTAAPVPGHDFDAINTADGDAGNLVPLQPLMLSPRVLNVTSVDATSVSVDVDSALASVNVHDDLAGAGPYPDLLDLSGVTSLIHREPGGGDETTITGCAEAGCNGLVVPAGRELCWQGNVSAVGHWQPGESTCEGGMMHGFACLSDDPEDACPALGGTCVSADPTPVAMGPAIPGGCTLLDAPADDDGDGFVSTADCDDADPSVHPGALQFCDQKNNDCNHPDWPALPDAECFAVRGLMVDHIGGQVSLGWSLPAGGADLYRIFRGEETDLASGHNGGTMVMSSPVNSVLFLDELPEGALVFYLVAGVRDTVQGSLGQDGNGRERSFAAP
jgi:hypothetical protein